MDYVPGERLVDCWDEMGAPQSTRTAKDLARALAEMFALTASHCGVLLRDHALTDSRRSLRYAPVAATPVAAATRRTQRRLRDRPRQ